MICTFNGFYLKLAANGQISYGKPMFDYFVLTPNGVSFEGTTFSPSINGCNNPLLVPIELLQWICLEYWSNDQSLFDHYNEAQLEFAKSDGCYNFAYVIDDAENSINNQEYDVMFENSNTSIINLIDTSNDTFRDTYNLIVYINDRQESYAMFNVANAFSV